MMTPRASITATVYITSEQRIYSAVALCYGILVHRLYVTSVYYEVKSIIATLWAGVLFHQHELNARRHCACMEDHVKGDEGDHLN